MVVAQQVVQRCLVSDVLEQNVQRLQQLDAHKARSTALLAHNVQKIREHIFLEKKIEYRRIVLVAPYKYFGNAPQRFDEKAAIVLGDGGVAFEDTMQVFEMVQR